MGRYSRALGRLGIGPEGRRFFDVHVAADARHGVIALERMVASLVDIEPRLGEDLLFGAAVVVMVEERFARHLLDAWSTQRSSLISPDMDLTGWAGHGLRVADASAATVKPGFGSSRVRARAG